MTPIDIFAIDGAGVWTNATITSLFVYLFNISLFFGVSISPFLLPLPLPLPPPQLSTLSLSAYITVWPFVFMRS